MFSFLKRIIYILLIQLQIVHVQSLRLPDIQI